MARLIDADALLKEYDRVHAGPPGGARKLIEDAPTVDLPDALRAAGWREEGWVSVKDRLPEPEENVIIWTKTGCMKYAQYHEDGSINPWYVYEDNARAWTNVISHWMPLPEPPKEENS